MSPEPRDGGIVFGLSVALLLGFCFVAWAIAGTTTPAEVADLRDSLGRKPTRMYWAAGPVVAEQTTPTAPTPFTRPSTEDLLSGRTCLPLAFLLENREQPAEHSFSRDVACGAAR